MRKKEVDEEISFIFESYIGRVSYKYLVVVVDLGMKCKRKLWLEIEI